MEFDREVLKNINSFLQCMIHVDGISPGFGEYAFLASSQPLTDLIDCRLQMNTYNYVLHVAGRFDTALPIIMANMRMLRLLPDNASHWVPVAFCKPAVLARSRVWLSYARFLVDNNTPLATMGLVRVARYFMALLSHLDDTEELPFFQSRMINCWWQISYQAEHLHHQYYALGGSLPLNFMECADCGLYTYFEYSDVWTDVKFIPTETWS